MASYEGTVSPKSSTPAIGLMCVQQTFCSNQSNACSPLTAETEQKVAALQCRVSDKPAQ